MMGVNAEYIDEFPKDKAWENDTKALSNQIYLFGKQYYKMTRCQDDVELIVTDGSLLNNIFYNKDDVFNLFLNCLVVNVFNTYNNMIYYINRVKPYNPKGRTQNESESDEIGKEILENEYTKRIFLSNYCKIINGCKNDYDSIINEIMEAVKKRRELLKNEK